MKNMWSDTACIMPEHEFGRCEAWGDFHRKGDFFRKNKLRIQRCKHCLTPKSTKVVEWETYGAEQFHGYISDWLPTSLLLPAQVLLKDLYQANNSKQWKNWKVKRMADFPAFMEALDELHRKGIIVKRETKDQFRTSATCLTKVFYNEAYIADIKQFIAAKQTDEPSWLKEPALPYGAMPKTVQGRCLQKLLSDQQYQLANGGRAVLRGLENQVVVKSSIKRSYAKMIRMLHGLYELAEQQQSLSWKTFSQQYFEDTKELTAGDKQRLRQLLGSDLSEFGIAPNFDELVIAAHFSWEYENERASSKALGPYARIPKQVIADMKLLNWQPESLLIIENEDLFEAVVQHGLLPLSNWAFMYGGGYVSSMHTEFLLQAEQVGLKHIYVWPDLDPYGYQIACQIKERLHKSNSGLTLSLFGFQVKWFQKSAVVKDLKQVDVQKIDRLLATELPETVQEVLLYMKRLGKKTEQEILIREISKAHFEQMLETNSIRL